MKTCTVLLAAAALPAALSTPTANTSRIFPRLPIDESPTKQPSTTEFNPDVEMMPSVWEAKNEMYKAALSRDDYDWTQAYTMDPIVKDIECSKKPHIMFPNRHLDCEIKCKGFFQDKMRFLGVPIYKVGTEGVWGYHFFQDGHVCMPRRACWLRKDWERKEKVLVFKLGGRAAYISALGGVEGDVEVQARAFSVKGLPSFHC
ncbi:hypothetical protein CDD82_2365 [Ophiocordyceps australis]|uniref:Uncharacterized protein n=1 Tax=Ophiocordyceps australis TaxID=1399860 RepID=A0A2C5XYI2_9HYPO|nr:hypothetical protein CDD82_2365 [Ophiocordyceps australis]